MTCNSFVFTCCVRFTWNTSAQWVTWCNRHHVKHNASVDESFEMNVTSNVSLYIAMCIDLRVTSVFACVCDEEGRLESDRLFRTFVYIRDMSSVCSVIASQCLQLHLLQQYSINSSHHLMYFSSSSGGGLHEMRLLFSSLPLCARRERVVGYSSLSVTSE